MTKEETIDIEIGEESFPIKSFDMKNDSKDLESELEDASLSQEAEFTLEGDFEKVKNATATLKDGDGGETRLEDCTIMSEEQRRERAAEIREQAPDTHSYDRTTDIEELISVLQDAKERGVTTVQTNDDGVSRTLSPRITNNMKHYNGRGPEPQSLNEWVEL